MAERCRTCRNPLRDGACRVCERADREEAQRLADRARLLRLGRLLRAFKEITR